MSQRPNIVCWEAGYLLVSDVFSSGLGRKWLPSPIQEGDFASVCEHADALGLSVIVPIEWGGGGVRETPFGEPFLFATKAGAAAFVVASGWRGVLDHLGSSYALKEKGVLSQIPQSERDVERRKL